MATPVDRDCAACPDAASPEHGALSPEDACPERMHPGWPTSYVLLGVPEKALLKRIKEWIGNFSHFTPCLIFRKLVNLHQLWGGRGGLAVVRTGGLDSQHLNFDQ